MVFLSSSMVFDRGRVDLVLLEKFWELILVVICSILQVIHHCLKLLRAHRILYIYISLFLRIFCFVYDRFVAAYLITSTRVAKMTV